MPMLKPHSECHRRLRGRNFAVLAVLLALVGGFYVLTLAQFGGG